MGTLVDPVVSKAKFDKEITLYKNVEREYCGRGWFLAKAEFPEVFVVFSCPKLTPPMVMLGVVVDFTNYDLWAPSVRLVNPFTRVPYRYAELPSKLERNVGAVQTPQGNALQIQPLMQPGFTPDAIPFLCIPGVREYHENPAHTADPWIHHRGRGEGSLIFILEQIAKYGVDPVVAYEFNIGITHIKLSRNPPPT